MKKIVFSVYDMQADIYDNPMVFEDEKIAVAAIRRNIRDMFLKKEVTLDALRDRRLEMIGYFDSIAGEFNNKDEDMDFSISVRMSDFVGDLVMNDGDEV